MDSTKKADGLCTKKKLYSIFSSATVITWAVATATILVLLLFFHENVEYMCKTTFGLSNFVLLMIGIVTVASLSALYVFRKKGINAFFIKIKLRYVILATAVLLGLQLFVFYNIYFKSGWDVRMIIQAAEATAVGNTDITSSDSQLWYFALYPNNLLITWVFSVIIRICNAVGVVSEFSHIFVIIIVQCILFAVSSVLVFNIVKKLLPNPVMPFVAWGLYWLHIGFNPHLTITYSDAFSLIFPISALSIYQAIENRRFIILKWSLIAVLSFIGFKVKPQVMIMLIAIILYDLVKLACKYDTKTKLAHAIGYCVGAIAICLLSAVCDIGLSKLPVRLDENDVMGLPHFLMMGFNEETGGVYSEDDVNFSDQFETADERAEANIAMFKERVKKLGFSGLVKFLAKKCMTNFGNGTYAWSVEGTFYYTILEEKNSTISPFLRSFYYEGGENYLTFITLQHYLWLIILVGNFGVIFVLKDKNRREKLALPVLALIGLSLFEMIFEARARYFFNFSPIFIITASVGWYAMIKATVDHLNKLKAKTHKKEDAE